MSGFIAIDVNSVQVNELQATALRMWGQFNWVSARAMTTAAKASQAAIRREIFPMIQLGPSPWTRRGLIVKFATPDDLTAMAGFQYGEGKWEDDGDTRKSGGVPAGRYMQVGATGGNRMAKSFELSLRRSHAIQLNQFVVPNDYMKVNAQGNLSGAQYAQVLSRLGAMVTTGNTTRASTRAKVDYFVMRYQAGYPSRWQLGANPAAIAKRYGSLPKGGTGKGTHQRGRPQTVGYPRGWLPAMWIVNAVHYRARFPIKAVAWRAYEQAFGPAWQAGFKAELDRRS